eukprot:TRINITY_DN75256_c0_g1_i1.p1 TRINITY_DN75256_c0_g1~~TRINITY_DN75256_c0_g1_i1.p1  ORF type:complete len:512 (+),score=84.64 TRINITY_DN75256_c0_g1_i1:75-1610(+)
MLLTLLHPASVQHDSIMPPDGACVQNDRRSNVVRFWLFIRVYCASMSLLLAYVLAHVCLSAMQVVASPEQLPASNLLHSKDLGDAGIVPLEAIDAPDTSSPALVFPPENPMAYIWWFVIFYMFYVMAIVCDDYLMPAVDRMIHVFEIPDDVAGATLVAFACNGPELLTNTVAIFATSGSAVGIGTVVGSAIFNCMCIVGACSICSPEGYLEINWKSFLRDIVFSALSIVILYWCIPSFTPFKSTVLFGMSMVYTLFVAKGKAWFGIEEGSSTGLDALEEKMLECDLSGEVHPTPKAAAGKGSPSCEHAMNPFALPDASEADSFLGKLTIWIVFVLTLPINILLYFSIPDCKLDAKAHLYIPAFFMSMAWLSAAAWLVCQGAVVLQDDWGIPPSFTGLTIVSIGTSWPNLWASVVMARAGRGQGAVANALGSNVQNVFLVLALPIWIHVLINGTYYTDAGDVVMSVLWMGFVVVLCWICIWMNNFRLTTGAGKLFIFVYFAYLCHAAYFETA